MLDFARERGAILQLMELEAAREVASGSFFSAYHQDLNGLELEIERRALRKRRRSLNQRTRCFLPQEVEVVKPIRNSQFCGHCHRLRITSDGWLKPCLLSQKGVVDILSPLRSGASESKLEGLFSEAIDAREPYWR